MTWIFLLSEKFDTYAANELLLRDEFGFVIVKLLKEALAPIPIFMKKEEKVLKIDLMINDTLRQVLVD